MNRMNRMKHITTIGSLVKKIPRILEKCRSSTLVSRAAFLILLIVLILSKLSSRMAVRFLAG